MSLLYPIILYFFLAYLDQKTSLDQRQSLVHSVSRVPSTVPGPKQGALGLCWEQGRGSPQTQGIQEVPPTPKCIKSHRDRCHYPQLYTSLQDRKSPHHLLPGRLGGEGPPPGTEGHTLFYSIPPEGETDGDRTAVGGTGNYPWLFSGLK